MKTMKYTTFIRLNLIFLSNKPYFVIKKTERLSLGFLRKSKRFSQIFVGFLENLKFTIMVI